MGSILNRLSDGYRFILVFIAVLLFYSNVTNYIFRVDFSSIPPKLYIYALTLFVLPFLVKRKVSRDFIGSPLLVWSMVYLAIAIIWFAPSRQSEEIQQVLGSRIAAVIFLTIILFILTENRMSVAVARWTILVCVLVAVANNVYEITHPFSFIPPGHELSNPGRAAGLYMNANQSGAAIIVGMIMTASLIPPRYRALYVFLVFIGVATTFSRAAILGWLIVLVVLIWQKTLRFRECLAGLAIVAIMGYFVILIILDFLPFEKGVNLSNVLGRLDWFANLGRLSIDAAQEERQVVGRLSWDLFAMHPLIGNGIGSTEIWSERISTHNMYLYLMADHGIIGALLTPGIVLAVTCFARLDARRIAIPFGVFVIYWGFFSHNILGERYLLISIALMSAISASSCHLVAAKTGSSCLDGKREGPDSNRKKY